VSQIVTLDPEIVFSASTSQDIVVSVDQLYLSYYKLVQGFEGDMRALHLTYMALISPATAELCRRAAMGKLIVGEDFAQSIHARSAHIADEAERIRISFERQHRAALELAKMV